MQEWNAWFREQQSAGGRTVEDFARESGLDVRSIAAYRKDRIPRMSTLAKIAAVLGDEGPLPKVRRDQAVSYNVQLGELRARADDILEYHHKLRVRVEQLEDAVTRMQSFEDRLRAVEDEGRVLADEGRDRQARAADAGTEL